MNRNLMTVGELGHAVVRRLWIVIVVVVIAVGSAYLYSKHQTPEYSATSTVGLSTDAVNALSSGSHLSSSGLEAFVAGQAQLAQSPVIVDAAAKSAGMTTEEFRKHASVSGDASNNQLKFSGTAATGDKAKDIANDYATAYRVTTATSDLNKINGQIHAAQFALASVQQKASTATGSTAVALSQQIRSLQNTVSDLLASKQNISGNRTQLPATSATKVKPITKKNVAIGAAIGIVIALAAIGLAEAFDGRVRRRDDYESVLGVPILGDLSTPPRSVRRSGEVQLLSKDEATVAEEYRRLRTTLDFANLPAQAKSIMICSAVEGEGKSTTCANLAVALVKSGRRVAILDLDLRRSAQSRFFEIPQGPGVVDVLSGDADLRDTVYTVPDAETAGRLTVVPAGSVTASPADLLESTKLADVFAELEAVNDVVLVDSPPLLLVTDAMIVSRVVDGLLIVVRSDRTKSGPLEALHVALERCPAKKLGVVMTGTSAKDGYGAYGYGYYATDTNGRSASPGSSAAEGALHVNGNGNGAAPIGDREPQAGRS